MRPILEGTAGEMISRNIGIQRRRISAVVILFDILSKKSTFAFKAMYYM
jgi:hypothetical protein